MLYLSPTYQSILPKYRSSFGYMLNAMRRIGQEEDAVQHRWMLDNGCFSDKWNHWEWMNRLGEMSEYNDTCIAAVAPDVVGNAGETTCLWEEYAGIIASYGFMPAYVVQDGITDDMVPWGDTDVLFIGGSTDFKLNGAWEVIKEAVGRGVWVHVGRVNSTKRIAKFAMVDSVDGTTLAIEPSIRQQENILWACEQANAIKQNAPLFMLE